MLRADAADERRRAGKLEGPARGTARESFAAVDARLGWGVFVNEMVLRRSGVRSVRSVISGGRKSGGAGTFRENGRVALGVVGLSDDSECISSQSNWPIMPSDSWGEPPASAASSMSSSSIS